MKFHLLHPGLTRYHHIALVVPALAALSPMVLSRAIAIGSHDAPSVPRAIAFGTIVAVVAYVVYAHAPLVREQHPATKAVLLGLLVAEFALLTTSSDTPSVVNLALFMFLYFFGISKLDV